MCVLKPLLQRRSESFMIKFIRSVFSQTWEHAEQVLFDCFMGVVVQDAYPDRQLLPEGWCPFLPQLSWVRACQRTIEEVNLGAPPSSWLLDLLSEVAFGFGTPPGKIRAEASDLVVEDVEGPVGFLELGPAIMRIESSSNGGKARIC